MTGQPDDPIVHLLSSLIEANVEFIVVGGAAAVLSGVPVVTRISTSFTSARPKISSGCSRC